VFFFGEKKDLDESLVWLSGVQETQSEANPFRHMNKRKQDDWYAGCHVYRGYYKDLDELREAVSSFFPWKQFFSAFQEGFKIFSSSGSAKEEFSFLEFSCTAGLNIFFFFFFNICRKLRATSWSGSTEVSTRGRSLLCRTFWLGEAAPRPTWSLDLPGPARPWLWSRPFFRFFICCPRRSEDTFFFISILFIFLIYSFFCGKMRLFCSFHRRQMQIFDQGT